MKIAVVTPSRGRVDSRTIEAVLANLEGHESVGWFLSHSLPIPECAENVVERALAAGAEAVWSIEEDTVPPSGALDASLRMLGEGYAVAAIDYPISQGTGCLSRDAAGNILWVGLGCTLIAREAFEKVQRPWFRIVDGRAYGGHDIYFCREVLRAGLRIGQVPGMIAKHVRLVELGKNGTNMGCHQVNILDRIDRQYSERPATRLALDPGTVILVPWRADGGERERLWTYCRGWWGRTFDAPIFEGVHEGPDLFNRAIALNRAAKAAGDWKVAVIIDADTLADPVRVQEAVNRAALTGQMVLPYDDRRELEPGETELVMHGAPLLAAMGRDFGPAVSGVVAVNRRLWDVVGGFDESFVGWGAEDNDFADACRRTGGEIVRLPGPVWHLHHTRHPDATDSSPVLQANRRRWQEHRAEWKDWRTLYKAHHPTVSDDPPGGRIPPILHRVVIGLEPETSRRWWAKFGELHPAWDLQTHSLPFDPKAWPLTSWLFPHTVHPAQLADFIRLEALWNDGGVYVDWDIEPYRPLDPLLSLEGFVGWALPHIAANGVMGFRPHHPAVGKTLDLAMARFAADRENLISIGPGAITEAVKGRNDVLLLPPQSFYAAGHVANPSQVEGQFAGDPWVYVVHWGHGTWKAEHPWKPEHEGRRSLADHLTERRQRQLALAQERLAARQRQRDERIRKLRTVAS
jgi:GT2 family glycosyltransferase